MYNISAIGYYLDIKWLIAIIGVIKYLTLWGILGYPPWLTEEGM